jgi:hypothetical protein
MISTDGLAGELSDLGEAIGLISNGGIDSSWFADPTQKLSTILSNPSQRQGLMALLDALLTPATIPGIPDGEKWYPLLGPLPGGNVYVTVNNSGPNVVFGIAADFGNRGSSSGVTADVQISLPLVAADTTVQAVAGTAAAPLRVALQAQLGLKKPPIQLDGISVVATIAPPAVSLTVTLQNLDLGDGTLQNVVLDPEQLESEAFHVVLGLLKQDLASLSGPVASHLPGVLGLGDDAVPQFPFLELATNPAALQNWFQSLIQGNTVPTWLSHLAGLIGATDLTVTGTGTVPDPWTVPIISIDSQSAASIIVSSSGSALQFGLRVSLLPGGASGPGRVDAEAVIAAIPLSGTGNAVVLPGAAIQFRSPTSSSAQLVPAGAFTLDSFSAGLEWNGSELRPAILLTNVVLNGTTYPQLDLTNADSVGSAAATTVQTAISNALGSSAGSHLMALTGLAAPSGDTSSPHRVDLGALVANPARAIGAFHRGVLLDGQRWSFLLGEIAGLIGVASPVSGTGTPSDPWLVQIAATGPVSLNLAAWNSQTSGVATDPQKLRLGLRARAASAPVAASVTSELLAFDLPENASGTASLVGAQHAALLIQPGVAAPPVAGFGLNADSFSAALDWTPGVTVSWAAEVSGLTITSGSTTVGPVSLTFPSAGGFDVTSLSTTAQALGLTVPNLELLLRMLLTRAALTWGGVPGYTLAALVGVHSGLNGLQSDSPVLSDPSGSGSLITDPTTALRNWLSQVTTGVSANGTPFLPQLINWLQSLLSNSLPSSISSIVPHAPIATPLFSGSGAYEDPWALPLLAGSQSADVLMWLEPAGPPAAWASAFASAASSAADITTLLTVLQALAPFISGLSDAVADLDISKATAGLTNLSNFLTSGDGVVPLSAQVPTGGTWTAGTNIQSAHPLEPQDPAAISQISAQIDSMAGGSASVRAVLLLGPAFSDHTTWQTFLGGKPSANFNFRVPNTNPAAIDLSTMTDVVDYYTCDLNDDGTGNLTSLIAQIRFAVARIGQLRPKLPVTLVAHSTAGVAARVFTLNNPSLVQGLITLGTPHLGTALPFLTDPLMASAIRLLQPLRAGIAAGPIGEILKHYFAALDGYLPASTPGALAVATPYPAGSFTGTPTTDTGGRPAFAIGSSLTGNLLQVLSVAVSSLATQAAGAGGTPPSHLSFGIRARLGLPASVTTSITADAHLRAGIFRVTLQSGAAEPQRPAQFLSFDAALSRPGDWLAGEPGFGLARVRSAEFGLDLQTDGAGGLKVTPRITLHQASLNGPMLARIDLETSPAQAQTLLGAIIKTISTPAPPAASAVSGLLTALTALQVTVANPDGSFGLSTDAFAAINTDAASFFGPRVVAALSNSGLSGFSGPSKGPWSFQVPGLPLTAYIAQGSWTIGLRTSPSLPLGAGAALAFDVSVSLPAFRRSLSATVNVSSFELTWTDANGGQLVAQMPPWLSATTLTPPPSAAALAPVLNDVLPRLLFSAASTALLAAALPAGSPGNRILTDLFGPDFASIPPDALFTHTAQFVSSATALGNSTGTGLDPAKLSQLLQDISQAASLPASTGISLPGGFQLAAAGSGTTTDPVALQLATSAPIGGVLGAQLSLAFDQVLHATSGGTISVTTGVSGSWSSVNLTFGISSAGLSLAVTPQAQTPIQVLPTFSGLGALAAGLEALLPAALDQLIGALKPSNPVWLTPAENLAQALGIYDAVGGFSAHADTLKTLLQADWLNLFSASNRPAVVTAAADLVNSLGLTPAATVSASTVNWSFPLSGADAGTVSISAGWDGSGPVALLSASGVKLGSGALSLDLSAGYSAGAIQCSAGVGLILPSELGIEATPEFNLGLSVTNSGPRFSAQFFPLASGSNHGPLEIDLAPQLQVTAGGQTPLQLLENWLLPLTANVAIKAANAQLNNPLWGGANATLKSVLTSAKILKADGTLNTPLPDIVTMVSGAIAGLASGGGVSVQLSNTLQLSIVNDSGKIALRLSGQQPFGTPSFSLAALFGAPSDWTKLSPGADGGLTLYLFTDSGGGSFSFTPQLRCAGVGLGLAGASDAPLVNLSAFRLGGFNGFFFFDAQFASVLSLDSFGGGLELVQLGIPLGLATSESSGNPVASSLLQSGGSSGDAQPVNPALDVSAWYWGGNDGDAHFHIQLAGQKGPFWIGVHSGFGPIYIDQLGVQVDTQSVELLIDGSVKINGLTAQVDELTVLIPYKSVTTPGDWSLDLNGLALGFSAPGINIAGALLKNPGPPIEYDGLLLIQITDLGFIAVGAYSTPPDPTTGGTFTSLFVFAGVFIVIGLPPIIDITGLGLGVGYNRELLPPTDLNQLSQFLLVEALDNTAAIANDPMGALKSIQTQVPAKRGSLWFAAGLHGNSFVVVNVTAVLYVALDKGVTIGILGIARMALPSDDTALVSLELALEVTFSPTAGTLLIIAQLTDNSWLLNKDCQLTGGFGYYVSFPDSQFVITIGGYHPAFQKPPAFPDVPRLGYHWSFLGVVSVKGESYFALTNTCVMAGARIEATYGPDWIQVWFTAYTDFLLSWDPFFYNISAGISLGASFRMHVCFIACVDIDISVSIGATLQVQGPPLNGTVTVDLAIASVTVSFGPDPNPNKNFLDWETFKGKYLVSQDPDNTAVNTHVQSGLIPPSPSGAQPTPGTADQPWRMTTEFKFQTETRMPAMAFQDFFGNNSGQLPSVQEINIAPMGGHNVSSLHKLTLEAQSGGGWNPVTATAGGQITFEPVIGQVSQATYQCIDHESIPAAAYTLPALLGVIITGSCVLQNPSSPIPISTLIDAGDSRPLPFATLTTTIVGTLQTFGVAADSMAGITAGVTTLQDLNASVSLLSGGGLFSDARAAAGLPPAGLPPMANRALQSFSSSAPLITPLTTGLTMKPVGLALPPKINRVLLLTPIPLQNLRLRAVLQGRPLPAADAPAAMHTSVNFLSGSIQNRVAVPPIGRFSPPVPAPLPGARLSFLRAAAAPRPTALARSGRTLRSVELGCCLGVAHIQAFQSAESQIGSSGVTITAGTIHVWDLPSDNAAVTVNGSTAVRVVFLNHNGRVVADFEESGGQATNFAAPPKSRTVAIMCLGNTSSAANGGTGAVTILAASQAGKPVAGWQAGNLMPQINSSTFLARGACVILSHPTVARKRNQVTAQGMIRLSQAVVDQFGIETWLPPAIGVVGLLFDQQDPTAAGDGDLAIAVNGATLLTPPVRVTGGARKILLYEVTQVTATDHIVVATASLTGSRLSGVVGLAGHAQDWANRWNGAIPEHIVPDGPLTPDGSISVTIATSSAAPTGKPAA